LTDRGPVPAPTTVTAAATPGAHEFPGCRPVCISRDAIADYDGRLEYWDAETETAWVVRAPVSFWHELPGQRLARLTERIAAVRGAAIETLGNTDLLLRNQAGERQRILQADQIVYLRQQAIRRLGAAIEIGQDELPDVILEVDLTTDVRRGKLALYESWGFPELWVDVPDRRAPSSPRSREAGLTIYVPGPNGYEPASSSRAFCGWSATEIHRALNEDALSGDTVDILRRVGRAMGATSGTGPDDDPFLSAERAESRLAGRAEGAREAVREILDVRNVRRSPGFARRLDAFAGLPIALLTRAAVECRDEKDFLQRLDALARR
jgi:Uma2 family endonuclease